MKDELIYIHNEIQDIVKKLDCLGYGSNRGCVEALREAQEFIGDEIDFLEEEE